MAAAELSKLSVLPKMKISSEYLFQMAGRRIPEKAECRRRPYAGQFGSAKYPLYSRFGPSYFLLRLETEAKTQQCSPTLG